MKTITIVLLVLVSLSLIFSLASFIIIITGNSGNIHINFNHPTSTLTPSPTLNITPTVTITYNELSRETLGIDTEIVLSVNLTHNSGSSVTLYDNQFILNILTLRGGINPPGMSEITDQVKPMENGNVTVGSAHSKANFLLTFEFPTMQENLNGPYPFNSYQLTYNDTSGVALL
jgi:hypothetical protein